MLAIISPENAAHRARQHRTSAYVTAVYHKGPNRRDRREMYTRRVLAVRNERQITFRNLREKARHASCDQHGNPGTIWWRIQYKDGHLGGLHLLCNECKVERVDGDEFIQVFQ